MAVIGLIPALAAANELSQLGVTDADSQMRFNLVSRMQSLQDEIRDMRGLLEDNNHQLQNLKKRQAELYLDLDQRVSQLEQSSQVSQPAVRQGESSPALVENLAEPTSVNSQVIPAVPMPGTVGTLPPGAPNLALNELPVDAAAESTAYQQSFDFLKKGQYQQAIKSFGDFLAQYPQSEYAGNAQYWIGEAHYVTRDFATALVEFGKVLTNYPNSPKQADAMLKMGYCYYEQNNWEGAKQTLLMLKEKWPASSAARLADDRLKKGPKQNDTAIP